MAWPWSDTCSISICFSLMRKYSSFRSSRLSIYHARRLCPCYRYKSSSRTNRPILIMTSVSPRVRLPGNQHLARPLTPEGPEALGTRCKQLGEALFNETTCPLVVVRPQPLPLQRQLYG